MPFENDDSSVFHSHSKTRAGTPARVHHTSRKRNSRSKRLENGTYDYAEDIHLTHNEWDSTITATLAEGTELAAKSYSITMTSVCDGEEIAPITLKVTVSK